jgi:hypothetical protein
VKGLFTIEMVPYLMRVSGKVICLMEWVARMEKLRKNIKQDGPMVSILFFYDDKI